MIAMYRAKSRPDLSSSLLLATIVGNWGEPSGESRIKGVVAAASELETASPDQLCGCYWPERAEWTLPECRVKKVVFAGP